MSFPQVLRSCSVASVVLTLTSASTALASQGPGGGPGTASALTQSVMAVVVYGSVALIMATGLARLLMRRF